MGVRSRTLFGAVLLLSVMTSVAFAQSSLRDRSRELSSRQTLDTNLEKAQLHYGPFYLFSTLNFGDIAFNENLLNASSEKRDFGIGVTAPQRVYLVPAKKLAFSLDFDPTYYAFIRDSSRNDFGYLYRGHVHLLFNHLYLDVNGGASHRQVLDRLELQRLARERSSFYGTIGELKVSSRTDIRFSVDQNRLRYPGQIDPLEGDLSQLGRTDTSYMARLTHATFPRTSLTLSVEGANYNFQQNVRDSRREGVYVGANHQGAGTSRMEVMLGLGQLKFRDPSQKDFKGLLGQANWSANLRRRYATSIAVQRDLEFSTFRSNSFYTTDTANFGVGVPVSRKLTLDAFGRGGIDRYPISEALLSGGSARRRDRVYSVGAGFLYSITDRTSAGLALDYFRRSSNFSEFDDDGIQLLLRLSIHP